MWLFLSNAFLSIVADASHPDSLKVRGRFRGDIERVFPEAEVFEDAGTDYKFRALISRTRVAEILAAHAMELSATNFKNSVEEDWRHSLCSKVWRTLYQAQEDRNPLNRE